MEKPLLSSKNDVIFKIIFGDQKNIDILEAFLKSVLDIPEEEYYKLTIVDPHLTRNKAKDKLGILDVKIETKNKKIIDVEIQVIKMQQMRQRIIFYTSKMITEQIGKSENYNKIQKVISILISDFHIINENNFYHNRYRLYDKKTKSEFTDLIEVNTLELPKMPAKDDNTEIWNWLKFFNSSKEEDLNMIAEKSPALKKAVVEIKRLSADEKTRLLYEAREKQIRDERSRIEGAAEEGFERGIKQGIEKGIEQGIEKGIEQGIEKGKIKIAKKMLIKNTSIELIAELTGLSIEEIKSLK